MKHEPKKISKIVDEILTYFLHHYGTRAEIVVEPEPTRYTIRFRFTDVNMTDEEFETLSERLVVRRQPELEDYYWQLAGEVEDNSEISLVGMMCDSIEFDRDGGSISLVLVRMV